MKPSEVFALRPCPHCDVPVGEPCRSGSGRRMERPHRARFPEGEPRPFYGRGKYPTTIKRARDTTGRPLPLDVALRTHTEERQRAFRERQLN